ncbi:hypothetical protein FJP64_14040 [Kosakonia cowanii]|uniref:hypothetical protein n=1 Tax=Kosakonia cowanii TaxID=208223 RepID=UPI00111F2189|nr:hypothetical protein [Kosakonia cowanii]MDP9766966.1 hypothetical protein [Atlantibacter hermannii]TPD64178.1 hypothetical protein FJP70_13395 [Kosakonia cowanii]TPD88510.1 hypothetical protein FJP67_13405 [Kosakonia cowanii]TPE04400.1 hypothetical protein FJP64_14040 [Kosakonia cowanii]
MNKPSIEELESQVKQLTDANQQLRDETLKSTSALYDVVAENVGMNSFVEAMLAIAWQGSSADGSDIQELALKCGLIRQEVYCADKHENMVDDPGNFEDGDALYFRVETPATDAYTASLRAEGVEMAMEAAKPEVANEFQRETFDQCVTAAVKYPQSDLAGKVEMVAWLELFAAQLRSKSEVQS